MRCGALYKYQSIRSYAYKKFKITLCVSYQEVLPSLLRDHNCMRPTKGILVFTRWQLGTITCYILMRILHDS